MITENIQEQIIELSISKNYVSNWHLWEAMREIFQNAIDADKQGHKMSFNYLKDTETLVISNDEAYLPLNSLVLGNSSKTDDDESIGKYGEGYKLALVVLLRLGYKVHITVGKDQWVPYFDKSKTLDTEVLMVKVLKGVNKVSTNGTSFVVSGLTNENMRELSFRCLPLYNHMNYSIGDVLHSEYGEILRNERFKGRFYVEGLYIQYDESFTMGYSFKNQYVDLDRDRRAINYYDLLELTTNSLISQTEDVKIVETSISHKAKDIHNLNEFYKEVSTEFAEEYAKHFIKKHNIDEDTFVGTEKEVVVSGSTKTYVTDEIQAKIVNKGLGKKDEYQNVKNLAKQKDNKDIAWKYYHDSSLYKLHQWLKDNCIRLSVKQINKFLKITSNVRPTSYGLISDDVEDMLYAHLKSIKPKYKRYKEQEEKNESI